MQWAGRALPAALPRAVSTDVASTLAVLGESGVATGLPAHKAHAQKRPVEHPEKISTDLSRHPHRRQSER